VDNDVRMEIIMIGTLYACVLKERERERER
jgi:hypothetical protein